MTRVSSCGVLSRDAWSETGPFFSTRRAASFDETRRRIIAGRRAASLNAEATASAVAAIDAMHDQIGLLVDDEHRGQIIGVDRAKQVITERGELLRVVEQR